MSINPQGLSRAYTTIQSGGVNYPQQTTIAFESNFTVANGDGYTRIDLTGVEVTFPIENSTSTTSFAYGGSFSGDSAFSFDITNAAVGGDSLFVMRNAATPIMNIYPTSTDGISIRDGSGVSYISLSQNIGTSVIYGSTTISCVPGSVSFYDGSTNEVQLTTVGFVPTVDNVTPLGSSAARWSNIYSGNSVFISNNTVTGQQSALNILANTAATSSGTQSNSPGVKLTTQNWNTTALAGQATDWLMQAIPSAASNPVASQLSFYGQINGGGYVERFRVTNAGSIIAINEVLAGTSGTGVCRGASFTPGSSSAMTVGATNATSVGIGSTSITTTISGTVVVGTSGGTITLGSATVTPLANTIMKGASAATNTTGFTLDGYVANGATSIGVKINNNVALTTAGAKLLSVQNNAVEKVYISKDGFIVSTATTTTVSPTTYTAVSGGIGFQNSWVDFGGTNATAAFLKDAMGFVHIRGTIKSGTIGSAAFTLPAGFRPSAKVVFPSVSNNGTSDIIARVDIDTTGTVTVTLGGNTYALLDGISFLATQ